MTIKPRERPVDDDDDPVEKMLKKSGCLELHYKVQISWTEEPAKARSGVHEVRVLDEEGFANLRRARRADPAATVAPLLAIQLHHPGSYSGPWVNSEVLATVTSIFVAYVALRNKSKILA